MEKEEHLALALIALTEETIPTMKEWFVGKYTVISRSAWNSGIGAFEYLETVAQIRDVAMMPLHEHGHPAMAPCFLVESDVGCFYESFTDCKRIFFDTREAAEESALKRLKEIQERDARWAREKEEANARLGAIVPPPEVARDASAIAN